MSGLLLVWNSDPALATSSGFDRSFDALSHRGPDGSRICREGTVALGHQHFRTTLEEKSAEQPLVDPQGGLLLALDGRIDNRAELLSALGFRGEESGRSDASLLMAAHRTWGAACFERLLGSWAAVIVDRRRRRILCSRDPLGNRPLYYCWKRGRLLVASEAAALLRHPGVSRAIDQEAVAHFFALEAPEPGRTFYSQIAELPPGHNLCVDEEGLRTECFWRADAVPRLAYRRDRDYVEHFRELLRASVECRLRGDGESAVLMSGGLDSTSVAALAAAHLRELEQAPPWAISWSFQKLVPADESRFVRATASACRLRSLTIPGDGEWPLRDLSLWGLDANAPWEGLYRRLQQRAYRAAADRGVRVLLTGEYGDELYAGDMFWLRDLLRSGRLGGAWKGCLSQLALDACLPLPDRLRLRSAVARVLGRPTGPAGRPEWLTERAWRSCGRLPGRLFRAEQLAHPLIAHACALETSHASRACIEVRRPYRDRRLIEFALSLPAHLLYRNGWTKYVLREAMRGILPDPVRRRRWGSTLLPLAARGLAEKEAGVAACLLNRSAATWKEFVRADWLERVFPERLRAGLDGAETVVAWQCLSWEIWAARNAISSARPMEPWSWDSRVFASKRNRNEWIASESDRGLQQPKIA